MNGSLQHRARRLWRASTIWHWISIVAIFLIVFRYLRPKTPESSLTNNNGVQVPAEPSDGIDWSRFAYCQYVTDIEYLCNSLMMFEALHRLGSKPDRLLLYPSQWELYPKRKTWQSMFLHKAQKDYGVHIVPVRIQHFDDGELTWAESFTKLLAFKQTQYERILSLDSDATILRPLDELFLLPDADVAAPTAYWIANNTISSALMLIKPSMPEFRRVLNSMKNRKSEEFDMDLVNDLYAGNAMILPNKHWLVSGEFRRKSHASYLEPGEEWDADKVLNSTQMVHFSDYPYPKPWRPAEADMIMATRPKCQTKLDGTQDCKDRNAWLWLYEDFKQRRKRVCGVAFCLYHD